MESHCVYSDSKINYALKLVKNTRKFKVLNLGYVWCDNLLCCMRLVGEAVGKYFVEVQPYWIAMFFVPGLLVEFS
jgi:hypothetical protein